jgi:hypothetical protein
MGTLSSKMGSWNLASSLLIIYNNYLLLLFLKKSLQREKYNKIVESTIRKPHRPDDGGSTYL